VLRPSVAEHVVRRASIPVLTVHGQEGEPMPRALVTESLSASIV
jgi:hypothetical protein